jgi:hypothetical protein
VAVAANQPVAAATLIPAPKTRITLHQPIYPMPHSNVIIDDTPPDFGPKIHFTRSQQAVYDSVVDHGWLYFHGAPHHADAELKPRLNPLIVGPTGCGKSMLVRQAAKELNADYCRLTYGDFVPLGAKDSQLSTLVRVGRKLQSSCRLLLHLDELDKFLVSDREWGRAVCTDLWNLLDGILPWEHIMLAAAAEALEGSEKSPAPGLFRVSTEYLFIVGSGTWQQVFEKRKSGEIGFNRGNPSSAETSEKDLLREVRASRTIPTELMARFSSDLLLLQYPDLAETEELLERYGLKSLAADLGIRISAEDVDYAASGMRAFESLKSRLLLEHVRRRRREDELEKITRQQRYPP